LEEALMARILALTSRVPWPPREGHQLRSYHVLDALASQHDVHLLSCLRSDDDPGARAPLRDKLTGFETFTIPAESSRMALMRALLQGVLTHTPFVVAKYSVPALKQRMAELSARFDLIHVDMLPLMAHVPLHCTTPVVLNAHNVEYRLLEARVGVEPRAAARTYLHTQVSRLRAFEGEACRRATVVLACSGEDAGQLHQMAPATPVHVVPNGVDLEHNRPDAAPIKAARMVFVGQMGWFPNRDGVEWFLAEVLPRIVHGRSDARFVLVGKHEGLKVPSALRGHVELAGFVPDVRRPVLESSVYVVPLRAGSGTRLKVLEAMALGKAIVTTHTGSEGIELVPGRDALLADDADGFAQAVLSLFDDPAEAARLGTAARLAAEKRYGWKVIGESMLRVYAGLTDRGTDGTDRQSGGITA
jgi:glycosyltransferase involved in cell wall biosynthesis